MINYCHFDNEKLIMIWTQHIFSGKSKTIKDDSFGCQCNSTIYKNCHNIWLGLKLFKTFSKVWLPYNHYTFILRTDFQWKPILSTLQYSSLWPQHFQKPNSSFYDEMAYERRY